MAFLGSAELADIRADLEDTFPTTCTISAKENVANGVGGFTPTWTARSTAVACRLAPAGVGSGESVLAEQIRAGQVWHLSVAWDQTLEATDHVTVDGNEYEVMQINRNESELFCKRAQVTRWPSS